MSEVDTQTVEWLWEPYIPFGKVTIVQGNPGEGKTTFALRLAAACTTGGTLPGMKAHEGDPDAIDTVLSHYAGYILYCSKVHGKVNAEVEEYVKQKLIAALFKFRFDR